MLRKNTILVVLTAIICFGGCTNTRYITDKESIHRQREMRTNRAGKNVGDVCLNFLSMVISEVLNSEFEPVQSDRTFKKIRLVNQATDTLHVNMVTDVLWENKEYCDIMGIVLPPGARQKLLVPYPAAYNIYFRTPQSEEEKVLIQTDDKLRRIDLKPGMTQPVP